MSKKRLNMALMVFGIIAGVVMIPAITVFADSIDSLGVQNTWRPVAGLPGAQSYGSGSIILARGGAKVRDHRSCAPNCGTFKAGGYGRPYGGGRSVQPPPVSPGDGQGGVTVTPSGGSRRIPCYGNLC